MNTSYHITAYIAMYNCRGNNLAETLRKAVETSIMVPVDKSQHREDIRITVSMGVAELDQQGFDSQAMIKKADMALYQAKREGRNRVITYQDEKA